MANLSYNNRGRDVIGLMTGNLSGYNMSYSAMTPGFKPYHLVWTPKVIFQVTMIVIVMVLTLIGNSTLIAIITFHKKLRRKRVNVFLVNLAIGDLMVCLITMTTEILFVAFGEWVLGAVACKVLLYGQMVTLASATFLLTAMSIDRYQVLVKPLRALTGQPKIWRKVLIAWAMAFIFATPQLFIFVQTSSIEPDGHIKYKCQSKGYHAQWQRKAYFTFLTVYILVIPTIIMSFCYMNIIKVVWMRTDSKRRTKPKFRMRFSTRSSRSDSLAAEHEMSVVNPYEAGNERVQTYVRSRDQNHLSIPKKLVSSSKRNVVKMTLSVIMGFVICWTPYFIVSLIRIYSDYRIKLHNALTVAEIMCQLHSALNPILYGIFSTKAARRVCKHMCQKCRRSEDYITRYETTALSDDETTWAETKFSRIHQARDNCNTNCNARTDKQKASHLHQLVSLIKRKCSLGNSNQPVTKIASHYNQYIPNASYKHSERRLTYSELADRSHLLSSRNQSANSPLHDTNPLKENYSGGSITYSDCMYGRLSEQGDTRKRITSQKSEKQKDSSIVSDNDPSLHVSWEDIVDPSDRNDKTDSVSGIMISSHQEEVVNYNCQNYSSSS